MIFLKIIYVLTLQCFNTKIMFAKCVICDKIRIFEPKVKCPEKNGRFCKTCVSGYLENMIDENNNTGKIKCPCGCGKEITHSKSFLKSNILKKKKNFTRELF